MRDLFDTTNGHSFGLNDDDAVQKVKLHDFEMVRLYETPDAVKVSETGEEADHLWLPKRLIEIRSDGRQSNGTDKLGHVRVYPVITVTMEEWLAKEKGLI